MLSPADYCREDWKCLICGAPKEELFALYPLVSEAVRCRRCYFCYTLQIPLEGREKRYVPRPARNKKWRNVWFRAWLHYKDPSTTRAFVTQFATAAQANNAMNRLDGGGAIAREGASRQAKEGTR